jgi:hypothetical protein
LKAVSPVYGVNPGTGEGKLVIRATHDAVNAALNQASGAISLWALTSGECQMNSFNLDRSLDKFVFDCAADTPAS